MVVIETKNLTKTYNPKTIPVHAVNGIDLTIEQGEFTAIVGPSGCGKTSLLNLVGGLDEATDGTVTIAGTTLNGLSEKKLTDFRLRNIGFVFQSYNLVPVLTARENIEFIMLLQKRSDRERRERVDSLLSKMNISKEGDRRPSQLSGGQQQRVAVARALASKPQIILADEPTANLDSHATSSLLDIMAEMNKNEGATFVFSTHDQRVIDKATRVVTLEDGKIVKDERR
jgi:putative ABC transport system ATP-binding protein